MRCVCGQPPFFCLFAWQVMRYDLYELIDWPPGLDRLSYQRSNLPALFVGRYLGQLRRCLFTLCFLTLWLAPIAIVTGATLNLRSTKYFVFALLMCYFEINFSLLIVDSFTVGSAARMLVTFVTFNVLVSFAYLKINDRCSCIEATTLTSSLIWLIIVLSVCFLPGFIVAVRRLSIHMSLVML